MPRSLFHQQIAHIIEQIEVQEEQVLVRASGNTYPYSLTPDNTTPSLYNVLINVIYNDFYITACQPGQHVTYDELPSNTEEEALAFLEQLQHANHTDEGFDYGWQLEAVEATGPYQAKKGNFLQTITAGDFISEEPTYGQLYTGQKVKIYRRKEGNNPQDSFYYVYSQTIGDQLAANNVRIYFNTSPESVLPLIKGLTTHFNRFQIPFDFKCLKIPSHYSHRTDTAVLYLNKGYANFGMNILARFVPVLSDEFSDGVPAFALPLGRGIAFAESPPNIQDSFGISRAKVIAQGIVQATEQHLPQEKYLGAVTDQLEQMGFDIGRFYLNPNANYKYKFLHINHEKI